MEKKLYIKPELNIHIVHLENMLALSTLDGDADPSGIVQGKGHGDWDIWGDGSDSDFDDDYDY